MGDDICILTSDCRAGETLQGVSAASAGSEVEGWSQDAVEAARSLADLKEQERSPGTARTSKYRHLHIPPEWPQRVLRPMSDQYLPIT